MAFDTINTQALQDFRDMGEEYVKQFSEIKSDFEKYNKELLSGYEGQGAEKYQKVSELITERVSDFEDVFNTICKDLVDPILKSFQDLDKYLDEQNQSMIIKEEDITGDDGH